jgi:hypothetical protein
MKINFKCDSCDSCSAIEEVLEGVTQYSTISDIEQFKNEPYKETVALDYGETNTEFGEISHFQCMNCGVTLRNHGVTITTPEELYEYLECNDMLKEN